ncbi:MAG: lytic transglycosylase domain-containing protein, partial [Cyanobacteria bacterium P01_H01_bin.121]
RDHIESYYAWRSASYLRLPVGGFTTVQNLQPAIATPTTRPKLPIGSPALQELYQIGQNSATWRLWQVEFTNRPDPTAQEQFTDGLVRMGVGDYLDGIFMLTSLDWQTDPEAQAFYQQLQTQPEFWQSLYPLPFQDLIQPWSSERELNPVLVTALIRQESRFMPGIVSVVGATGLMQVLPETADWIAPQIDLEAFSLSNPEDNVELGTWYLDYTHSEWSGNSLLAVASYNAGPGNVADWLNRFSFEDPDGFVEQIPFPETRGYVESVFGNYWNYLRLYNPDIAEIVARYTVQTESLAQVGQVE